MAFIAGVLRGLVLRGGLWALRLAVKCTTRQIESEEARIAGQLARRIGIPASMLEVRFQRYATGECVSQVELKTEVNPVDLEILKSSMDNALGIRSNARTPPGTFH